MRPVDALVLDTNNDTDSHVTLFTSVLKSKKKNESTGDGRGDKEVMKELKTTLSTIVALLCSITTIAHDFEADGIYYNITSSEDLTVEVTYRGDDSYNSYSNEYTGEVLIPENIAYNGNTYSVIRIGEGAFYGCSSLMNINIPNSVTNVGKNAFQACSNLTSITIPNSVTSIGEGAFSSCTCLTSITLPNSVINIDSYTFAYCSSLTTVNIPSSVTNIGEAAFSNCSGLTSITIPNSVTSIGNHAFFGCYGLTNIIVANSVPPTIAYNDTFSNESYQDATLYAPKGSLRAYQTAISWSKFLHVEEYDARGIESAQVNNARVAVPIYGLQGQQMKEHIEHLPAGIYIQGGEKFIVK